MTAQVVARSQETAGSIIESVIVKGDLAKLSPEERTRYYVEVCKSAGLNPMMKPFEYITLNGKLTLYALRGCTDQLRSIHGVSVEELVETERDGVFIVTAKVKNAQGRTDMAKGAVNIGGLKGEALANALMKAETKAKRRATLSLCGLGLLDETEVETIPGAAVGAPQIATSPIQPATPEPPFDPSTGEVKPHQLKIGYITVEGRDRSDWIGFGKSIIAAIKSARTREELSGWIDLNQSALASMSESAKKAYASVQGAIAQAKERLAQSEVQPETEASGK
jgi:hypothetical protein